MGNWISHLRIAPPFPISPKLDKTLFTFGGLALCLIESTMSCIADDTVQAALMVLDKIRCPEIEPL